MLNVSLAEQPPSQVLPLGKPKSDKSVMEILHIHEENYIYKEKNCTEKSTVVGEFRAV